MRPSGPATAEELTRADAVILAAVERWESMMRMRDASPAMKVGAEARVLEALEQRRELRSRGRVGE